MAQPLASIADLTAEGRLIPQPPDAGALRAVRARADVAILLELAAAALEAIA